MKKRLLRPLSVTVSLLLCLLPLFGCAKEDGRPVIVTTTYLMADLTREVLGDTAKEYNITVLASRGEDIHSYEPTVGDIYALSRCELFIHVGGESEEWVQGVLRSAQNPDMRELSLMSECAHMLCRHEHEHEAEDGHGHSAHEHEYDEHIWFSFDIICESAELIAREAGLLDSGRAQVYSENAKGFCERVRALEAEYISCVENAPKSMILVADRFPFFYLTESLGIEYEAAFDGCSAESEASFALISELSYAIDREELSYVLVCEGSDRAVADAVISNTKQKNARVLVLDSMQSVKEEDVRAGWSYLLATEKNLEVLRTALGG